MLTLSQMPIRYYTRELNFNLKNAFIVVQSNQRLLSIKFASAEPLTRLFTITVGKIRRCLREIPQSLSPRPSFSSISYPESYIKTDSLGCFIVRPIYHNTNRNKTSVVERNLPCWAYWYWRDGVFLPLMTGEFLTRCFFDNFVNKCHLLIWFFSTDFIPFILKDM